MNTSNLFTIVTIIAIVGISYYIYTRGKSKEGLCQSMGIRYRTFALDKDGQLLKTDKFKFKSWDGVDYEARVGNDGFFYVNKKGSDIVKKMGDIQILRFRSAQWFASINGKYFVLSRLNGVVDLNVDWLDLIDWDDYSYSIKILTE